MTIRATTRTLWIASRRALGDRSFAATSILTLALGIGATVAIFSVIQGVLLRPLPYDQPESLVAVWHRAPGLDFPELTLSAATYLTFRDHAESLQSIGLWDVDTMTITGDGPPEEVEDAQVSIDVLPMLGARPLLGRLFVAEDGEPQAPQKVILSHQLWQRRFGGANDIVGRNLMVFGRPREIVGVLTPGFRLLEHNPEVYYPLQLDESNVRMGQFNYNGIARLAPDTDLERAAGELDGLTATAAASYPEGLSLEMLKEAEFGTYLVPLGQEMVGDIASSLWLLFGTVGVVLLIACANVANLFLVRAEGRRRELALRSALGASRGRLCAELVSESVILALFAGALGCVLAWAGLRLLVQLGPQSVPRLWEIGLHGPALGFALLISVLSGLALGILPLLGGSRGLIASTLAEGGRGSSQGRERHLLRSALVVGQIALALLLLIGAGLLGRSYQAINAVDLGIRDPASVLTFRVSIPSAEVPDLAAVALMEEQIVNELRGIPGVVSVATANGAPMSGLGSQDPVSVEGFPLPSGQLPPIRRYRWISGDYFETLGRRLVAGRTLTWDDVRERRDAVVVSENMAREYWPDPAQALGVRIKPDLPDAPSPWWEIVGVVSDVYDDGPTSEPPTLVYWPSVLENFWEEPLFVQRSRAYLLRVSGPNPKRLLPAVQAAVARVNPNLPVAWPQTLRQVADRTVARTSFTLVMLAIASAVALLLGVVGIYGVLSYIVRRRTREIGVRMALGATPRNIGAMVTRTALLLASLGVATGASAALLTTRLMAGLLHGVAANDPWTFAGVSLLLATVALLASVVAAARAARVDPVAALSVE